MCSRRVYYNAFCSFMSMIPRLFSLFFFVSWSLICSGSATSISPELYDDFVHYFRYASSAYAFLCPKPNGQTSVKRFHDHLTDARGFIARDDTRQDVVVAFAGTTTLLDVVTDAQFLLRPFDSLGIHPPDGTTVHEGFLKNWNAVAATVFDAVETELQTYPDYNLIITGHSMGGAMASLGAISLQTKFPLINTSLYTYGQPRTGNDAYAYWVNEKLADRAFRVVHKRDWVANVPPRILLPFETEDQSQPTSGEDALLEQRYRHHGIEYWQNADPPSPNTTIQCSVDGEDPECSNSNMLVTSQLDHLVYFGILAVHPFCL